MKRVQSSMAYVVDIPLKKKSYKIIHSFWNTKLQFKIRFLKKGYLANQTKILNRNNEKKKRLSPFSSTTVTIFSLSRIIILLKK